MRTDGTARTKLNSVCSSHIEVVGDWIYYTNWGGGEDPLGIYKMRTDGTNDMYIAHLNYGNWWYLFKPRMCSYQVFSACCRNEYAAFGYENIWHSSRK